MLKRKTWIIVAVGAALVLCTVCAVIGSLVPSKEPEQTAPVAGSQSQQTAPEPAAGPTHTPVPEATVGPTHTPVPTRTLTPLPIADIDFHAVREQLRDATHAQKDHIFGQLRGQRVRWSGWIEDVSKEGKVSVDMDPPEAFSVSDVTFQISKEDALNFTKDQAVTFEGTIRSISEFLGSFTFQLEDVVLLD